MPPVASGRRPPPAATSREALPVRPECPTCQREMRPVKVPDADPCPKVHRVTWYCGKCGHRSDEVTELPSGLTDADREIHRETEAFLMEHRGNGTRVKDRW